jgi:hypothetical protein
MPCAADKGFSCELQRAPLLQIRPDDASFFYLVRGSKGERSNRAGKVDMMGQRALSLGTEETSSGQSIVNAASTYQSMTR